MPTHNYLRMSIHETVQDASKAAPINGDKVRHQTLASVHADRASNNEHTSAGARTSWARDVEPD